MIPAPTQHAPRRPIIRYHGGKWRLAPWIVSHFPEHRVYVEPFGGGGSVLLNKARSYAEIYNDLDDEMVNLFAVARDRGEELAESIRLTPFSRREFFAAYEPSDDPLERARRTMIRAGMGFGSTGVNCANKTGFRADSKKSGTTPAIDWSRLADNLRRVTDRLRGVVIENLDALILIEQHDGPETLFYVDPPYVASTRTWNRGKGAYKHEMDEEQHRALAARLNAASGAVILSGYPSDLYDDCYAGWNRIERAARADKSAPRTECLWLNARVPFHPELF